MENHIAAAQKEGREMTASYMLQELPRPPFVHASQRAGGHGASRKTKRAWSAATAAPYVSGLLVFGEGRAAPHSCAVPALTQLLPYQLLPANRAW